MHWIDEELFSLNSNKLNQKITISILPRWLFFFIFFLILIYLFKVSILENKKWATFASINNKLSIKIPAPRGLIFDKFGKPLAINKSSYDLIIDFNRIKFEDKEYFSKIIEDYNLNFNLNGSYLIIKNIPENLTYKILSKYPNSIEIRLVETYKRIYKTGEGFGNFLGYLGFPNKEEIEKYGFDPNVYIGKLGIEKQYQKYLEGLDGSLIFEKDSKSNIIRTLEKKEPVYGHSIYLTINSEFQKEAYELFKKYLKERGYKKGGFIMLNPNSGEIISLVSYPDFDNNLFQNDKNYAIQVLNNKENPLFNRVISGLYAPGSVIKPIIAIAALEEKIIDPEKKIYSSGELIVPNPYNPTKPSIFKDWKAHGWVNMKEAIANSVNVYFYTIGGGFEQQKGLGINKIIKYFKLLEIDKKSGVDFPMESQGFIPYPEWKKEKRGENWLLGDTYNISIGQGDLILTPLRIALFTGVLATNKLVKPYIVEKILDYQNKVVYKNKTTILKENIFNKDNLKIIQEGMRMTVTEGTAKTLLSSVVPIAGKSGTPQIMGKKMLNAFFTGYAPYDNPQIVLTLFIEEVPVGSVATLPIYKDIIDLYFKKYVKYDKQL
jgi:penicillin-binding protein 2